MIKGDIMKRTGIIYLITNLITKKHYVGQTIDFKERIGIHRRAKLKNSPLHRSVRKHGWEKFSVIKLHEEVGIDDLDWLEKHCIFTYNTISPNGYNIKYGGHRNNKYRKRDHPVWNHQDDIIEGYLQGLSLMDLANRYDCSIGPIRKILIENNIPRRRNHTERTKSKISKGNIRWYRTKEKI